MMEIPNMPDNHVIIIKGVRDHNEYVDISNIHICGNAIR